MHEVPIPTPVGFRAGHRNRESKGRDRDMERAERRFQRAVKTLKEVQRHLPEVLMAVQINMNTPGRGA